MKVSAPLRTIAAFEAAKGMIVLLAGFGTLALIHFDAQRWADYIVAHLHLDLAKHEPKIFVELANQLTNSRMWMLALAAAMYALVRFVEAYGLWYGRRWAEWFAVLSGCIYIPFELREVMLKAGWLPWAALLLNLLVVGVMGYDLKRRQPEKVI